MAKKKSLVVARKRLVALKSVLMDESELRPVEPRELKTAMVELVDVFLLLLED